MSRGCALIVAKKGGISSGRFGVSGKTNHGRSVCFIRIDGGTLGITNKIS